MDRNRKLLWLLGGVLLVTALRAFLWWGYGKTPLPRSTFADPLVYIDLAKTWASGHPMPEKAVFHPPLYPYLLGLVFKVFGPSMPAMIVIQNLVGIVTGSLILAAVLLTTSRLRPFILMILLLLQGGAWISYEWRLYPESLSTNLQVLAILALWWVWSNGGKPFLLGVTGLLLGGVVLLRPNLVLVLPFLAAWCFLPETKARLGRFGAVYLFVIPAVVLVPILVRNHALGAGYSLTANVGITFAQGNNPAAQGRYTQVPGVSPDILRQNEDAMRIARANGARSIAEGNRYWFRKGLDWWKNEPVAALKLAVKRGFLFFGPREIGGDMPFEFEKERVPPLRAVSFANFLFVSFFALFSLGWLRRLRFPLVPAAIFLGATFLTCVVFYMNNRYRLPVWPLFSVAAAFGLDHAIAEWRRKGKRKRGENPRFVYALSLLIGAGMLLATVRVSVPPAMVIPGWHNWGVMSSRAGLLPQAEEAYRKVLEIDPTHLQTLENLSFVLMNEGKYAEAEEVLSTLTRTHPASYLGQVRMAQVLIRRGDGVEAEPFARRALSLEPGNRDASEALEEARRLQASGARKR